MSLRTSALSFTTVTLLQMALSGHHIVKNDDNLTEKNNRYFRPKVEKPNVEKPVYNKKIKRFFKTGSQNVLIIRYKGSTKLIHYTVFSFNCVNCGLCFVPYLN